ncbi:Holliday junction resolvase RuvX [Specibacter sp. NPDC057265]|uniref:Holliday junction resolvase RuvX n=1 Tax=Specibacter sp. NPDC057265 TaxID=3346075 RepID=UPI00363797C1
MSEASYPQGVKLGVDVGMVRVGLACCDAGGILATPVKTLSRDVKKNSDVKVVLKEALARQACQIFVGLPRTMKGEEKASAQMARSYAAVLATLLAEAGLDIPVHLIDERLTTVSAHQSLHQAGMSSREHRKVVDQVAAVEILQHALDMQKARNANVGERVRVPNPDGMGNPGSIEHEEVSTISTPTAVPGEKAHRP